MNWKDFDVARFDLDLLVAELEKLPAGAPSPPAPLPEGEGSEKPELPTDTEKIPAKGRYRLELGNVRLRFRSGPGKDQPILTTLKTGDVIEFTGDWDFVDNLVWLKSRYLTGTGWLAMIDGLKLVDVDAQPSPPSPLPEGEGGNQQPPGDVEPPGTDPDVVEVVMRVGDRVYVGALKRNQ